MAKSSFYEVKEGKQKKTRWTSHKRGPGVFLAKHRDRLSCGKCGYAEFDKKN